jgi:hypothetical protein
VQDPRAADALDARDGECRLPRARTPAQSEHGGPRERRRGHHRTVPNRWTSLAVRRAPTSLARVGLGSRVSL